jgi:septum formation inhibitor-activating ATPase MinD
VGMAAAIALAEAVSAYAEQNPEFEPVRNASRRLLGLAEADYRQASPKG